MLLYDVRSKKNSGFTLIEMLTAIIIVGVLASIAAPNFLGLLNRNRLNQALEEVEGAIRESQRLAMRRGKTCTVNFTSTGTGSSKYSVVQASAATTGCLLNTRQLPSSVSFGLLTGTGASATVVTLDSDNVGTLNFSGKGNPDIEGTMVISHPDVDIQKCVRIEGLLGNILTGDFDTTANVCKAS